MGVQKKQTGKLIGYARVSTEDQELRLQIDALEKVGCHNIWKEKRSATKGKRPELEKAIIDLRPGDTLVVWKLDRLARNARELYARLDQINDTGAQFKSLQEQFDFTTAMGQFVLGILGLVAQLEAQMTSQRTAAGIKALQERGFTYGARPKLSKLQAAKIVALRKGDPKKWTMEKLSKRYSVSTSTVINYLKRAKDRRKGK